MLDILPLEIAYIILQYVDPFNMKKIAENIIEWRPAIMTMNRKQYAEKWLVHKLSNYPLKYQYIVKNSDYIPHIVNDYWYMILLFTHDTHHKINDQFKKVCGQHYICITISYPVRRIYNFPCLYSIKTQYSSIQSTEAFKHLYSLDMSGCRHINDVSMLGILHTLNISSTSVIDVSMLGKLHSLNISNTMVTDVSALGGLHTLLARNTPLKDVSMLGKLHTLDISGHYIIDSHMLTTVCKLYAEP